MQQIGQRPIPYPRYLVFIGGCTEPAGYRDHPRISAASWTDAPHCLMARAVTLEPRNRHSASHSGEKQSLIEVSYDCEQPGITADALS